MSLGITEYTSIIIAGGVIFNIYTSLRNHQKITEVQKQTNGLSAHLVKLTGTSEYARGLKKGNAKSLYSNERRLQEKGHVRQSSKD